MSFCKTIYRAVQTSRRFLGMTLAYENAVIINHDQTARGIIRRFVIKLHALLVNCSLLYCFQNVEKSLGGRKFKFSKVMSSMTNFHKENFSNMLN